MSHLPRWSSHTTSTCPLHPLLLQALQCLSSFFVARDLFRQFQLLKYGISFVLCFYGTDMLFPNLFTLSPIEGCGLILAIMLLCILLSLLGTSMWGEERFPLEDDLSKKDYGTES